MAIISGTTVSWELSPRVITIPVSDTSISVADLQDTLQDLEDSEEGIVWPHLRNTSGGEDLGGGVSVGLTMELQDAQVAFAPRTTNKESGTATTADATGTVLTDSTATFVTNGVLPGATVVNFTDQSVATVLSVDSETQLTHYALDDGTGNDWGISDVYKVYNETQTEIAGGNTVAVDGVGSSISAIFPTFGTQVLKTSSSSATTQNQEQLEATTFIGKEGLGVTIDPVSGTDSSDYPYGTRENPCKTEANVTAIETARGFRNIYVTSSLTITGDHSGDPNVWFGDNPQSIVITVGDRATYPSKDVTNSKFQDCFVTGELDSNNIIWESIVGDITDANGFIYQSTIFGTITVKDNISMERCWIAPTAPSQEFTLDFNGQAKTVIMSQWSAGRVRCSNMVTGSFLGVSGTGGRVIPDTSNTGGTVVYAGAIGVDDTFGANLDTLQDSTSASQTWLTANGADALTKIQVQDKLLKNKTVTDPVSGIMTVYDDDDATPLFTANIWENVAGTTAYSSGSAINRKDRFT